MTRWSLSRTPGDVLLRDLRSRVTQEHASSADILAHLGEVESRGLYRAAADSRMWTHCQAEQAFGREHMDARRVERRRRDRPH